jgi:hypothetical protein
MIAPIAKILPSFEFTSTRSPIVSPVEGSARSGCRAPPPFVHPAAFVPLGSVLPSALQKKPGTASVECRLRPMTHSWVAGAEKVCSPPFLQEVLPAATGAERPQQLAERSADQTSAQNVSSCVFHPIWPVLRLLE